MVYVRVRLRFDSSPLNYAKKCWFVFDADQCSLVKDVAYLITCQFDLNQGIQLYMDDFLIPVNESAQVIRDNDLIWVKAIEGESDNTSLVLSDDVQTPKAKRKKVEKTNNQRKRDEPKVEVPCRVAPKAKTIKQVKTLLNSVKVIDSSSKSKPSSGKLKAVTKQSPSGALHTTFHTSSSSSSSSSETSSSESSEPDEVASEQRNVAANKKPPSNVAQNKQALSKASKVVPPGGGHLAVTGARANLGSGQRAVKAGGTRRDGRNRKKPLCTNLTVGGDHDILTTTSTVYKSPVQAKTTEENSKSREADGSDADSRDVASDRLCTKKSPATTAPKISGKVLGSQWDVQPPVPVTKIPSTVKVLPPVKQTIDQPPRDYSALPELHGPPRQGDKLAFKILELSSSYTPVVSEYKEASVLGFDPLTKMIDIEYSNETLMKLKFQSKEAGKPGRFEMQLEEEEDEQQEPLVDKHDQITLDSLIEPKLIT